MDGGGGGGRLWAPGRVRSCPRQVWAPPGSGLRRKAGRRPGEAAKGRPRRTAQRPAPAAATPELKRNKAPRERPRSPGGGGAAAGERAWEEEGGGGE